jgi:serine/threonine protein kinase
MRALYRTLLDIAAGMEHIHANGVMHCDLNGESPCTASQTMREVAE